PPQTLAELQRVSGSLSLGTFNFRATDLRVVTKQYSVVADGRIALRYPYNARLDVQWQYELPPSGTPAEPLLLSGSGVVQGDITQLDINHALAVPFDIRSHIQLVPN